VISSAYKGVKIICGHLPNKAFRTSFMLSVQRTITNGKSITADVIDDPLVNYYHHVCICSFLWNS